MRKMTIRLTLAIVVLVTGAASILSEFTLMRSEAALVEAHQRRWDCWHIESAKVARCRAIWKLGTEDGDYCREAMAACAANGMEVLVQDAEATQGMWHRCAATLRLALLALGICSIGWLVLKSATWLLRRLPH
jgi:hypothetical protein